MKLSAAVPDHGFGARIFWRWSILAVLLLDLGASAANLPVATNVLSVTVRSEVTFNISSSTPALAPDGTIYLGMFDGTVRAYTPTGSQIWQFQTRREIKSSPAIADDGTIYFGCRNHKFYALTPAGSLKWTFDTGAWVDSSPAIARDGTVYFGSWDKNFYALAPDGSLKWKYAVGGIIDSSPAIGADGTIYFGSHNKLFYAFDPAGQPRWTFPTQAEITASPAIAEDGSIYISSTDGNLYHLNPDGTEIWRCRIGGGSDSSPIIADNGNVVIAGGRTMFIISPAGKIVWQQTMAHWINLTAAAGEGMVCFWAQDRELWARDPDGQPLWEVITPNPVVTSPMISDRGLVYCCTIARLLAYQPPTPRRPAQSSWPMFRADARHTGRVAYAAH